MGVEKFLVKNSDVVAKGINELFMSSRLAVLREIFQEDQQLKLVETMSSKRSSGGGSSNNRTVSFKFKQQLQTLMDSLKLTHTHYVRCIKPNEQKMANNFNNENVSTQLTNAGVMETIRIRGLGYPIRFPFDLFLSRYKTCFVHHDLSFKKENMKSLLVKIFQEDENKWQIGHTKVFLKDKSYGELEKLRGIALTTVCLKIQSSYRRYFYRKQYLKMKESVFQLQKEIRKYLCRIKYLRLKRGCILLQSIHRMKVQRKLFLSQLEEFRRKERERKEKERLLLASLLLQKTARGFLSRLSHRRMLPLLRREKQARLREKRRADEEKKRDLEKKAAREREKAERERKEREKKGKGKGEIEKKRGTEEGTGTNE